LVSQIKVTQTPPDGLPQPAGLAGEAAGAAAPASPPMTEATAPVGAPPPLADADAPAPPPLAGPAPPPLAGPAPPDLQPGDEISGHKIIEYVGGSTYTGSYKASQTSMGRTVLFKALRRERAADEQAKAQFFSGARAAARLNHPNLLSVFDMGEADSICFYTTEFVDGGALPQFLAARPKISSAERLAIATQIAQALAHAESTGVQHVWIGPEDVLLTEKGDVRVGRVGTGSPLGGGQPQPILTALARLAYFAASSTDLPPEAVTLNDPTAAAMPAARDATGTKLNALVWRLVSERQAAYKNCEEFAAELEAFRESIQRRSTVSAAAAPGGVVPLRVQRARTRSTSMQTILLIVAGVTALLVAIALGVFVSVRSSITEKESTAYFNEKIQPLLDGADEALRESGILGHLNSLYAKWPDTTYGRQAPGIIANVKQRIVAADFRKVRERFKDTPEDVDGLVAAIRVKQDQLGKEFSGLPFIKKQAETHIRNARIGLDKKARSAWEREVESMVRNLYGPRRLQFGAALEEVRKYREKWVEASFAKKQADRWSAHIKSKASKTCDEMIADARAKHAQGHKREAASILDRIISDFGIEELARKARGAKQELQNN
jgi:hypothetical protein